MKRQMGRNTWCFTCFTSYYIYNCYSNFQLKIQREWCNAWNKLLKNMKRTATFHRHSSFWCAWGSTLASTRKRQSSTWPPPQGKVFDKTSLTRSCQSWDPWTALTALTCPCCCTSYIILPPSWYVSTQKEGLHSQLKCCQWHNFLKVARNAMRTEKRPQVSIVRFRNV